MQYQDIKSKVYLLTNTNSSSLPDAQMVILANNALERVESLAMHSDARWQFDDTNNTDLPIATTALVANQQDYSMATSHISITRVECLDTNGNWILLAPFDQNDLYNQSLTDYLKASGTPAYYDKMGSSIFLYPKPSYSQASSLKLYFKRGPNYFVSSDTTKQPGFNIMYHDLVAYWIAYEYAIANGSSNATTLMSAIQMKETALQEDYSMRGKDEHLTLRARQPNMGGNFFR